MRCARAAPTLLVLWLGAMAHAAPAAPGEARAGISVYAQPAPGAHLIVLTPQVGASVEARRWLTISPHYLADVVTGATPRIYGPPDAVSAATPFFEVRHAPGVGVEARVRMVTLSADYTYGIENDYRSHLVGLGLAVDLFQRNTTLLFRYGFGLSSICDRRQEGRPVVLRQPLDRSQGCFTGLDSLTERRLDQHTGEVSITQVLHRKIVGALIGSVQHLDGFQSNPYRQVRLLHGQFLAQESHPTLRTRGALTARLRIAVERVHASLAVDLRLYRDTWGLQSITGELGWEQPFAAASTWSWGARARGYAQSGAVFFRDAGDADSYDAEGPVGAYFTADQELAPLGTLTLGARLVRRVSRAPDRRWARAFTGLVGTFSFDWVKIFPLSPEPPNAARARSIASALVVGVSGTGTW